jgi:hypothetical protein
MAPEYAIAADGSNAGQFQCANWVAQGISFRLTNQMLTLAYMGA